MLYIKNKNGKVLWSKKTILIFLMISEKIEIKTMQKIVDINNDGINEVVLTSEDLGGLKMKMIFLE